MSEQHVSDLTVTYGLLIIQLHGSPQEVVTMAAIDTKNDVTTENAEYFNHCTITDDDGKLHYIYQLAGVNPACSEMICIDCITITVAIII